jgi:hypothetical protein
MPVLVERQLKGRYEIPLRYAIVSAHPVNFLAAGYGHGRKPKPGLFEDVHEGLPDAGLAHEQRTVGLGDAAYRGRSLLLSCFMRYYLGEGRINFTN